MDASAEEGDPSPPFIDYRSTPLLITDLTRLQSDTSSSDVTLLAGPSSTVFQAHSAILSARCPALLPLLATFLSTHPSNIALPLSSRNILRIPLPTISPDTLATVLTYAYTGRLRLRSSNVFLVLSGARDLSMARLVLLCEDHVRLRTDDSHALVYLTSALTCGLRNVAAGLVEYVARRAGVLVAHDEFTCLPRGTVEYILRQEDLSVTEGDLWTALVRWACIQASVAAFLKVSEMDDGERGRVRHFLRPFLRAGLVKVMNISAGAFAREVEPLGLLSADELLAKYRYDATAETDVFCDAFPLGRLEFLSRIRQQSVVFESSHPHAQGASEKFEVVLPSWTKMAYLTFDLRCKLGRYAALEFYENDFCTEALASLDSILAAHRVAMRSDPSLSNEASFRIPLRRFWFAVYAPSSFPPAWGYLFCVRPSIV